jgi:hypothetical protein
MQDDDHAGLEVNAEPDAPLSDAQAPFTLSSAKLLQVAARTGRECVNCRSDASLVF